MKLSFGDYLRAAFNARPIGMLIPPNWIGLGLFGLLGLLNPGFWLMGMGLELGYLLMVTTNSRFQNLVNGLFLVRQRQAWQKKLVQQVGGLSLDDQQRYRTLEGRCQMILRHQGGLDNNTGLAAQSEGLGKLLWIYLRLLITRQSMYRIQREATIPAPPLPGQAAAGRMAPRPRQNVETGDISERVKTLQEQLADPSLNAELRKSLTGQMEILQQRLAKQAEARDKLQYLEAELTRIQEQVELIREQAVVSTDPSAVSQRIDEISATLGGTTQWIHEQQSLYGQVEDLMAEPPPVQIPAAPPEIKQ